MAKKSNRKHKHVSKQELLRKMHEVAFAKKACTKAPFSGMITLVNYTLWKDFNYDVDKLVEFNQKTMEYENNVDEVPVNELNDRLFNYANFNVEFVELTKEDIVKSGNKTLDAMEMSIIHSNNKINQQSTVHLVSAFNALIDMSLSKEDIEKIKDAINHHLAVMYEDDGVRVMEMHKQLYDELGLFIEMPSDSTLKRYMRESDDEDATVTQLADIK